MTSTNKFSAYKGEYSFSAVRSVVESCVSQLQEQFNLEESDLTEGEKGSLTDLTWEDLERMSENTEWVSFEFDNTIVKVYVYGEYSQFGEELVETKITVRLKSSPQK